MIKNSIHILRKSKLYLIIVGFCGAFVLTSACHCDDEEEKIANNKVLLLKFHEDSHDFIEAKEYKSFNTTNQFSLNVSKENDTKNTITNVTYKETNALLLKVSTVPLPEKGKVIIPSDFAHANTFEHVTTNDYILPKNGYKTVESYTLNEILFEKMWTKIQSLVKVRAYLNSRPQQQVQIFFHQHSIENSSNGNWIFILKN